MEEKFKKHIETNNLFSTDAGILLAVSGGLDSVCMAHLFYICGYKIAIAHVNHGLRGDESDAEERFVIDWAESRNIEIFCRKVDVKSLVEQKGMGIQEAARMLRYRFLEEIAEQNGFDFIATAHHLDDTFETFLFNAIRGTGIKGLRGIPSQRANIIRPLLFARRSEILTFAQNCGLQWMDDSSNLLPDYTRNEIRLKLIPALESVFPDFRKGMSVTVSNINRLWAELKKYLEAQRSAVIEIVDNKQAINISELSKIQFQDFFLSEFLSDFGFAADRMDEVLDLLNAQSGKQLHSVSNILLRDRQHIFILPKEELNFNSWNIDDVLNLNRLPDELEFSATIMDTVPAQFKSHEVFFQISQLKFPLVLRNWKAGDRFKPLGMTGNMSISDFLTQLKLPLHQKNKVLVLCSGESILWVAGFRVSEEFRLTKEPGKILKFSISPFYYQ